MPGPVVVFYDGGVVVAEAQEPSSVTLPTQQALPTLAAPPTGTEAASVRVSPTGTINARATMLRVLTTDPATPMEGEVWIRGDQNQMRWREGGVTYQVTGTAV